MKDAQRIAHFERWATDVLAHGAVSVADELVTSDIEFASSPDTVRGTAAHKRFVTELSPLQTAMSAKVTAVEIIGPDLVATLVLSGQAPATHRPISVTGRVTATFRGNMICRINVGYLLSEWRRQAQSTRDDADDLTRVMATGPAAAESGMALSDAGKVELMRTLCDMILVRGIHGAAADLCTEDFVYESPLTHLVGMEVCNRYIRDIREAWQDIQLELSGEQVDGRNVTAEFSLNAIHSGVFYGVDATFRRFTIRGTVKARIRGDKISRVRVSYFLNEWLRQVGAEQQP